ncbi:hypothetical protein JOC76_005380 [Neobacillus cucumis]|nr:hypothetical protein [Neobacillus cucumis]
MSWEKCKHDNYKIEADFSADPICVLDVAGILTLMIFRYLKV